MDAVKLDKAHQILRHAADLTSGDRDRQHGSKEENFENVVALWNGYLRDQLKTPLTAHQGALMMALLKIARTKIGALNLDDYVDGAGYMGCAGEIVQAGRPKADDAYTAVLYGKSVTPAQLAKHISKEEGRRTAIYKKPAPSDAGHKPPAHWADIPVVGTCS